MTQALKGRNVIAQGKAPARESALLGAPPCVAATNSLKPCKGDTFDSAAAIAALDSRLRGNDGILNGGLAFGDYVRREQMRLLFALDNALSQKAESAITGNFAAVKKADIALQTGLGGRQKYAAMHLVGAFSEGDSHAIGWQLRGYGGRDKAKGANAGLFFRTINSGMLYGANAFLDYEDGNYGDFARFGAGGELRHKYFALAANYYLPMTDERRVNATVAAFSREGYDANLRVAIPYLSFMKLRADYYHFDGKGQTAKDDGFRYGMELSPSAILRLAVYYDKGAEKVGGDIAIGYQFGEVQGRQTNSPSFLRKQESPCMRRLRGDSLGDSRLRGNDEKDESAAFSQCHSRKSGNPLPHFCQKKGGIPAAPFVIPAPSSFLLLQK